MRVADQFRLWCTFEASVVAERRLPVFIAGRGIATSQVAMKHLGVFFFAFPGIKPPPEVRSLAYMNTIQLLLSVAAPIFAPFFIIIIVSGTLGIIFPAFRIESAYTRNGQMVLRAMADGVKRAKLGVSAGASVQGSWRRSIIDDSSDRRSASRGRVSSQRSRGGSSTTSCSSTAAPEDSGPRIQPVSPPPSPPSPMAPMATADGAGRSALHTLDAAAHSPAHAVAHAGQEAAPALAHLVEAANQAAHDLDDATHSVAHAVAHAVAATATEVSLVARQGLQRSLTSMWTHKEETLVASLQRMLPWLPSYDRRDALVVRTLLDMVASELSQSQRVGTESLCALAASCFSAAKLMPSAGDPVGKLDVQNWLAQKAIHLPMTRPLPLPALAEFGWRTFRGSPDQLITPGGRLRVMGSSSMPTPTPSSEWDASQLEVVREAPIAWQFMFAAFFLVSAVLYIGVYITLALDFTIAEDADQVDLTYTIWLIAAAGWMSTASSWLAMFHWHIRYPMANYPHPVHGPSFAMILGGDGYDALKDFAAYLAFHVANFFIPFIPLLVMDTAAFTRPSALLRTAYSSDLVRERHPASPVAAQVAYIATLVCIQAWSMHYAIDVSYATWHMWHCGRRAGRDYFIRSPDSKSTTVVRFAAQSDA